LGEQPGSTNQVLKLNLDHKVCKKVTSYSGLPCDDWLVLIPGKYNIYVQTPSGKSNKVDFTVLQ